MTIDKLLEEADEDPYAFGLAGVKQLAAEVRRMREREKVLTEALIHVRYRVEKMHHPDLIVYDIDEALSFDKPPIA